MAHKETWSNLPEGVSREGFSAQDRLVYWLVMGSS